MRFGCLGKGKRSYSVSAGESNRNSVFAIRLDTATRVAELNGSDDHEKSGVVETEKATDSECQKLDDGSDFETAIQATKYGKYNWFLLSIGLWGYMSAMSSTTAISLILPSIGCDMKLSNFDKGMLNGSVFVGMVLTAFFWGLISDVFGRRIILIVGYAFDAGFCIVMGLAQSYTILLTSKILSGFLNASLVVILSSLVAENHSNQYRASVIVGMGIFSSVGNVVLPLLAWIIIPLPIHVVLFDGFIRLTSWKMFLLATSVPSILAFLSVAIVDESPRFLMFQNRNEKALKVFQRIYATNTGNPRHEFPIKRLKVESSDAANKSEKTNFKEILVKGWKQAVTIFHRPYLFMALVPCTMQFCTLMSMNTIRLWTPELFAKSFERGNLLNYTKSQSNICEFLKMDPIISNVSQRIDDCSETVINKEVYLDSMIIGVVTGIGFLISGYIVKLVDIKWLLIVIYGFGFVGCIALYRCTSSSYLLGIVSVFVAITTVAATAISSIIINIFPTSLRTTALSICLSFGRGGALIGNLVFPILLDWICVSPFIFLAFSLTIAGLSAFSLPKTKGENLK